MDHFGVMRDVKIADWAIPHDHVGIFEVSRSLGKEDPDSDNEQIEVEVEIRAQQDSIHLSQPWLIVSWAIVESIRQRIGLGPLSEVIAERTT